MMSTDAEVLIVGAGPAGAALAIELARKGRDVLIVERSAFPRDKPCGDCLNPGAVNQLRSLGVADRLYERLSPTPLRGWRIQAPDGLSLDLQFGKSDSGGAIVGWAVRRRDFDEALLDEAIRAGARVQFGARVSNVLLERRRVVGVMCRDGAAVHEVYARFIVGADGIRSVVQRRLGLKGRKPRLRKIALVAHLDGLVGSSELGELRVRGGHTCGYVGMGAGANLTLVVPESEAEAIAGRSSEFLSEVLRDFPEVAESLRRFRLETPVMVTGPFDHPVRRAWTAGAALIGDAAGYYDPFTGQGVHQALWSARLVAPAIEMALRDPSVEVRALKNYGRQIRQSLLPKRTLQRVIEAAVSRPRVMSWFLSLMSRDAASASRVLRAVGDLDHPAGLLDPGVWSRLLLRVDNLA